MNGLVRVLLEEEVRAHREAELVKAYDKLGRDEGGADMGAFVIAQAEVARRG